MSVFEIIEQFKLIVTQCKHILTQFKGLNSKYLMLVFG